MLQPNEKIWGPWLPWGKRMPPDGLGEQRFQAVYINQNGEVMNDAENGSDRQQPHHIWFVDGNTQAVTLAYRVQVTS